MTIKFSQLPEGTLIEHNNEIIGINQASQLINTGALVTELKIVTQDYKKAVLNKFLMDAEKLAGEGPYAVKLEEVVRTLKNEGEVIEVDI